MQPVKKTSTIDAVVNSLAALIASGEYHEGDKLPSETFLANELKVGRSTIREATRYLQAAGAVELRPGKGAFVASRSASNNHLGSGTTEVTEQWLRDNKVEINDFFEVRYIVEPSAAALAAERLTKEDEALLSKVFANFEEAFYKRDYVALTRLEEEFHYTIVKITKNELLITLFGTMLKLFRVYAGRTLLVDHFYKDSLEPHRRILGAILLKDSVLAKAEMLSHLKISNKHFLEATDKV